MDANPVKSINDTLADLNIFTVKSAFAGKKALYRESEFLGLFRAIDACKLIERLERM